MEVQFVQALRVEGRASLFKMLASPFIVLFFLCISF